MRPFEGLRRKGKKEAKPETPKELHIEAMEAFRKEVEDLGLPGVDEADRQTYLKFLSKNSNDLEKNLPVREEYGEGNQSRRLNTLHLGWEDREMWEKVKNHKNMPVDPRAFRSYMQDVLNDEADAQLGGPRLTFASYLEKLLKYR